jgi:hypothetical protein
MFSCCFRRKNNQELSTRSVVPQNQQLSHDPLIFPDAVIEFLSSLLRDKDKLKLSAVSRAVNEEFGGKLEWVTLRWRKRTPTASLLALLKRQECLLSIGASSTFVLPPLFTAISRGYCPFLTRLSFGEWRMGNPGPLPTSIFSALAGLIKLGALNSLEDLLLGRCEKGGVEILMQAFEAGGCPKLNNLGLPLVHYIDRKAETYDLEQTERNLEALADAFEARRNRMTCKSLKHLYGGYEWMDYGNVEVRARVLRVLLPSLEVIPYVMPWEAEFVCAFNEVGAPCLESFPLPPAIPVLVEALSTMRDLYLRRPLDEASIDAFILLMQRYGTYLLPKLEILHVVNGFSQHAADAERFFMTVGETLALSSVRVLNVCLRNKECVSSFRGLSYALAQGVFPRLQAFDLSCRDLGGPGLMVLSQTLQGSPLCANTLVKLELRNCRLSYLGGVRAVFEETGCRLESNH